MGLNPSGRAVEARALLHSCSQTQSVQQAMHVSISTASTTHSVMDSSLEGRLGSSAPVLEGMGMMLGGLSDRLRLLKSSDILAF